jgi:hypothetical protein
MKILIIAIIVSTFAFSGCASVTTHGDVLNGNYISNRAKYSVKTPEEWHATTIPPSPNIESKINSKLIRGREIGYLVKNDNSAFIIIETYALTWIGKPVLILDITWNEAVLKKFNEVCKKVATREKERSLSKFSSSLFQCTPLAPRQPCRIDYPCLEITKEKTSPRDDGFVVFEKSYVFDDIPLIDSMMNKTATPAGWRVRFTLLSSKKDYLSDKEVLEQVINTMRKVESNI